MTFTINKPAEKPETKIHTQYWKGFRKQTEIEPTKITPTDEEQAVTGTWLEQLRQTSKPSALSGALNENAISQLSLGGALSDEEERAAQQSARSAYSARGLVSGRPAAAAEVLNRDAYSRQRLLERQNFGLQVEDQNLKAEGTRTASSAALGGGILDYFGGIRDDERAADEFNINRYDSRYMFDRKAAMDADAADKNAEAAKKAGNQSMLGSLGGAAIGALALAFL
jgi:hypothetical protein